MNLSRGSVSLAEPPSGMATALVRVDDVDGVGEGRIGGLVEEAAGGAGSGRSGCERSLGDVDLGLAHGVGVHGAGEIGVAPGDGFTAGGLLLRKGVPAVAERVCAQERRDLERSAKDRRHLLFEGHEIDALRVIDAESLVAAGEVSAGSAEPVDHDREAPVGVDGVGAFAGDWGRERKRSSGRRCR